MASSKSLGTLTVNIVAETAGFVQGMSKADRAAEKWRKQVDRDLKAIRGGINQTLKIGTAAVAAATAATIALTKQGMDAVRSQADLARSLDTTFDSITALNMAAGDVGLEGMEGSLTRLNRRLGAAERGAGAAANAVKELNLDLGALSNMTVDERVATIADAIRDSGVSMQRAARYAQDLGFEQQQAAEFFYQGGDAIRAYASEVDALGLSLSDIDAQKVVDAHNAMGIFGDLVTSASQRLAAEFSPILQQVASDIEDVTREAGGLGPVISDAFNTGIDAAGFFIDAIEGIKRTFQVVGSGIAIIALSIKDVLLTVAREIVELPTTAANEMIKALNQLPGVNLDTLGMSGFGQEIEEEIQLTRGAIQEGYRDIQRILMEPLPSTSLKKYVADARAAAEESARAALEIRENFGMDGGLLDDSGGGSLDASLAKRRAALIQLFETERETVIRIQRETAEEIEDLYNQEVLSKQEADLLKLESEQRMFEELRAMRERDLGDQRRLEAQRQMLILGGSEQLFGSLAEMTSQFAGEQNALYKTLFAFQKAASIAQSIVAINTGIAQAAALPFPANLGAMATVAGATAGIVGNIQAVTLTGMAHDGIDSVPKTGTWLLEKGERVMTSETSKKLDQKLDGGSGVVVNLYEDSSKAGQVQQGQRDDGTTEVNVFVSDIMSNGPRAKAMQRAYGLRRQGT